MTIISNFELYSKAVSLGLGEDLEAVWSWILQKEELVSHSQPPPALVKYQNLRYNKKKNYLCSRLFVTDLQAA
jgi:hypothetical protein